MWRPQAQRLRIPLQNGALIEAHGAISLYEQGGQYQLYADTLRLAGEGAHYQEFLRLKARLEAEGLFDELRKRPIPESPQRIGIVTSATGAALQDILNTLRRRYPLVEVLVAACAVQGAEAPAEIVRAILALNRMPEPPQTLIIARGGGSLEDLWAFNDEAVVRAIANSEIPVITGVGHETDFTLADFAADLRAPTPTAAAELATPDINETRLTLAGAAGLLKSLVDDTLQQVQDNNRRAQQDLLRASPLWRIQNGHQRMDALAERSHLAVVHALDIRRLRFTGVMHRLEALNPQAVLQRGYALVTLPDGRLIRSVEGIQVGDRVRVSLADGSLETKVEKINKETARLKAAAETGRKKDAKK
jgi:exodeoxyribonuclease VII large subunit